MAPFDTARVEKYHDIFENIKNIKNIKLELQVDIENIKNIKNIMMCIDIFDTLDIFQKMKISNKLYNNGCNTLMQYLVTISYQSFVPYVKT